jgi:hypothetical protein
MEQSGVRKKVNTGATGFACRVHYMDPPNGGFVHCPFSFRKGKRSRSYLAETRHVNKRGRRLLTCACHFLDGSRKAGVKLVCRLQLWTGGSILTASPKTQTRAPVFPTCLSLCSEVPSITRILSSWRPGYSLSWLVNDASSRVEEFAMHPPRHSDAMMRICEGRDARLSETPARGLL